MIISFMQVTAASFGQNVTLKQDEVSMTKLFYEIRKQTGYNVLLKDNNILSAKKINANFSDTPLDKVMEQVVMGTNLTFEIADKKIFIKEKTFLERVAERFQRLDVSGKVTGEDGSPLAGANIKIKGTGISVSADAKGEFALKNVADDAVLVVSFIGYEPKEVKAAVNMSVVLKLTTSELDEVTINKGYYNESKKLSTGSVSKVTADEINNQPINNPLQAIQGRMPGVYISQNSGLPGSNFIVQIRGRNSIAAGNDPLYIVDGIPYPSGTLSTTFTTGTLFGSSGSNPLSSLSPDNIESIEVLKDADATAIYGSRGSNGVILITTKKAVEGSPEFTVNLNRGVSTVSRKMNLMNTTQYIEMRKEAFRNDNSIPTLSSGPDLVAWDTTRYTDWQKEFIGGNAEFTNLSATFSGGTRDHNFVFNNSFQNQGTVFPGDAKYKRGSSHLALNHSFLDQKITVAFDVTFNTDKNAMQSMDLTSSAVSLAPNAPAVYDENGNLNWENSTWSNPLAYLKQTYEAITNNFIVRTTIGYKLAKDFQFKNSFGYNDLKLKEKSLVPSTFYNPATNPTAQNASSTFNVNSHQSWIWEPQLTFKKILGRISINALLGSTFQNTTQEQLIQRGTNFASDALINAINAAGTVNVIGFTKTQYRYSAVYGRVNVAYDQKYILNLTSRRDGSSRFGPENRFANFMAAGFAWVFSKENIVNDNIKFLSFGKLRASYGTTGNDQIGDYAFLDTYQSNAGYAGGAGLVPTRLHNSNYAWEINRKFEVAMDLSFFKDRFDLKVNYYSNRSSNQLVGYPLPLTTGFSSVQANLGATVRNSGWELEIITQNISSKELVWSTSFNTTIPRNKLIAFPHLENSTYATRYVVGQPITISKRYHFTGVDPVSGVYQFEDMNGDGSITSADRLRAMNLSTQYYGGVNNSIHYKNFQLDILFQYVKQTGNNYQGLLFAQPGMRNQQPSAVIRDHWRQPGDQSTIQKFSNSSSVVSTAQSRYRDSDEVVEDASFIRLKNINLSYVLPASVFKGLKCRLYAQAQNLVTFTNYYGLDPESMSVSLPTLRTITAGLQLTF